MKKLFTFLFKTKIGIMSIFIVLVALLCWSTHWNTRATETLRIIHIIQVVAIVMGIYASVSILFVKDIPWIKYPKIINKLPPVNKPSEINHSAENKTRIAVKVDNAKYIILTQAIKFIIDREHLNFPEEANRVTKGQFENVTYEQFFSYCKSEGLDNTPIYHLMALKSFRDEMIRADIEQSHK